MPVTDVRVLTGFAQLMAMRPSRRCLVVSPKILPDCTSARLYCSPHWTSARPIIEITPMNADSPVLDALADTAQRLCDPVVTHVTSAERAHGTHAVDARLAVYRDQRPRGDLQIVRHDAEAHAG